MNILLVSILSWISCIYAYIVMFVDNQLFDDSENEDNLKSKIREQKILLDKKDVTISLLMQRNKQLVYEINKKNLELSIKDEDIARTNTNLIIRNQNLFD